MTDLRPRSVSEARRLAIQTAPEGATAEMVTYTTEELIRRFWADTQESADNAARMLDAARRAIDEVERERKPE